MRHMTNTELFDDYTNLVDLYRKIALASGLHVDANSGFDSSCIIVSEDIAAELLKATVMNYIKMNKPIIQNMQDENAGIDFAAQMKLYLADTLDRFGPQVDANLEPHSIILLEGFVTSRPIVDKPEDDIFVELTHVDHTPRGILN